MIVCRKNGSVPPSGLDAVWPFGGNISSNLDLEIATHVSELPDTTMYVVTAVILSKLMYTEHGCSFVWMSHRGCWQMNSVKPYQSLWWHDSFRSVYLADSVVLGRQKSGARQEPHTLARQAGVGQNEERPQSY